MGMQGNSSVEAVVCLQSLKLLPDLPRFLAEAHRVLKPGSPFIFLQPGRLVHAPYHPMKHMSRTRHGRDMSKME